jgi:hypothetical protein
VTEFQDYDDVGQWVHVHGVQALRELLQLEQMRSISQSLASIWLSRHEQVARMGVLPFAPTPGRPATRVVRFDRGRTRPLRAVSAD